MYADLSLDVKMLKDLLSKSSKTFRQESSSHISHQTVRNSCSTSMHASKPEQIDVVFPEQEG